MRSYGFLLVDLKPGTTESSRLRTDVLQTGSGVDNSEAIKETKDDDSFDTESTTSAIENDREDLIACRDCGLVFVHLQGLEDNQKSIQLPMSGEALEELLRENSVDVCCADDLPAYSTCALNANSNISKLNGTEEGTFECVHRSGEFYVIGFFDGSNWLYRCIQDTFHGTNKDAIFYLSNDWAPYAKLPTICDVCIVKVPDVKCTIPAICPVTRPGQIQCKACDYEGDGLCCS
ncbi:unnamed protein product [Mytilus coruscus]|uniref:Uncharacterized protein n=1 Tax=Mytilus coruscus TaxID=42192 RepID=A0A6J8ERU0_MYTCO|nr:unnamed protein product [Mytilus coruscus]